MRVWTETDFKSHKQGLINAWFKTQAATKMGMTLAVREFMSDCLHVPPTCPRKTGSMAASHSALVEGSAVATSESEPHSGGTGATPLMYLPKESKYLEGAVVVHKWYAAAQHEGVAGKGIVLNYTTPGSDRKWVESKLIMFSAKYFQMIASAIRSLK